MSKNGKKIACFFFQKNAEIRGGEILKNVPLQLETIQ